MTKFSFEVQWPLPFAQGWQQSSRVFGSSTKAANALANYLAISLDNGCIMEGRLKPLINYIPPQQ